jgi:hypothetical protein
MKTEVNYKLDNELITVTHTTLDIILKKSQYPSDCISLYMFYAYTAKWQSTNRVFAVSDYAKTGLGIGKIRFAHAKSELKRLGLIEDYADRDKKTGKINKWYIKVNYILNNSHPTENRPCGEVAPKCFVQVSEMLDTSICTAKAEASEKNTVVVDKPQPTTDVDSQLQDKDDCSVSCDTEDFDDLFSKENVQKDKERLFNSAPSAEETEKLLAESANEAEKRSRWLKLPLERDAKFLRTEFISQYYNFYRKNTTYKFTPDNYGKFIKFITPIVEKVRTLTELVCREYYRCEPTNEMFSKLTDTIFDMSKNDKLIQKHEYQYYILPSALKSIFNYLIEEFNSVLRNTNRAEIMFQY